jgi:16S rRNA (cytosine1402-N4)-methyltransferase
VLLEEVIEELDLKPDGIYVDGTLGGAGHSSEMLRRAEIKKLIGIDQDPDAIKAASKKLEPYGERAVIVKSNYENIGEIIKSQNIDKVDGILLDLGVSSYQLDTPDRGFSYMSDAPLDMRMDTESVKTASDIINDYSEQELFKIIRDYGEDRFAKNIAKHIVAARSKKKIETTFELNEIIRASIPAKVRETGGHPSKRTFQAIRIELNRELEVLENSIGEMIDLLNDKGRLCIITFHSLEDRIVKAAFNTAERPCVCPPGFPVCVCGAVPKGRVITKKPVSASEEELLNNKRASSAKLRVFERT